MKQLFRKFKQISILILAIAFIGCEKDEVVIPQVVAGFTYTLNIDTGTVTFLNISENATNYDWDFGDESSSTLINPVKVYTSGTYTVTLTAKNVAGASDSFEDVITIQISELLELPITFDNPLVAYVATTFDGAGYEVLENPDLSGTNPIASNVGSIINSGAAFEGIFFDLDVPVDLSTDNAIKMNFWSDTLIDVLLKLEEGTGADVETTASHGGTGWEEIEFSFISSSSFSRFTIFADGPGTNPGTFYMDDIQQVAGNTGPACTPETGQSLSAADFNLSFQNDPTASIDSDGAGFAWIDNPDSDNAVNTSCKVGQIDRTSASMFANNQINLDAKLDFTSNEGFKLKVWSPTASTNVLLKLEDQANSGAFVEVPATTSAGSAGQWEELTFNFTSNDSNKYDKIVLFFELATATQETYYIDDLTLFSGGGGGTCDPPSGGEFITDGGFEANAGCWQLIDNGGTTTISTTINNGGSNSGQIKTTPGSNPALKQERFGIGTIQPNTTYVVQFDIQANASDMPANGAVFQAFTFSEPAEGSTDPAVQHVLVAGDASFPTTWNSRTYTFTTAGNVDGGVSLLMEMVCGGVAGCTGTINIDNVSITAQ